MTCSIQAFLSYLGLGFALIWGECGKLNEWVNFSSFHLFSIWWGACNKWVGACGLEKKQPTENHLLTPGTQMSIRALCVSGIHWITCKCTILAFASLTRFRAKMLDQCSWAKYLGQNLVAKDFGPKFFHWLVCKTWCDENKIFEWIDIWIYTY